MLNVKKLYVKYPDGTEAISDISFHLSKNDNIALIGANGSGKSTLFLALVGAVDFRGEISTCGITLSEKTFPEIRKKVGLVFQNPDDQLFSLTVFDDVAFSLRNAGLSESEVNTRVNKTLEEFGISHIANKMPHKLSGGEKRMAAIASVMTISPDIILFDEPTAFLDHMSRRRLIDSLKKISQPKIIATHDLSFAEEICNRVIVLKNGAIVASGEAELLCSKEILEKCGLEALTKNGERYAQ